MALTRRAATRTSRTAGRGAAVRRSAKRSSKRVAKRVAAKPAAKPVSAVRKPVVPLEPVVPHPQHRHVAVPLGGEPDAAFRLRVLGGVGQQVADHLGQAGRVGHGPHRAARLYDRQLVAAGVHQRADVLDGPRQAGVVVKDDGLQIN